MTATVRNNAAQTINGNADIMLLDRYSTTAMAFAFTGAKTD